MNYNINSNNTYKLPRIYVDDNLSNGCNLILDENNAHYLKNVLRKNIGDYVRIFNGVNGEWLCIIDSINKKHCNLLVKDELRKQGSSSRRIKLFFSPIKKQRMDWLIEKSVELGVTDFYPFICEYTDNRKTNFDKIKKQIIGASEQSERLDVASFHEPKSLINVINGHDNILSAIERLDSAEISTIKLNDYDRSFLIGPEGGFSEEEKGFLQKSKNIIPVSLGMNILRAETAALYGISILRNK